VHIPDTLSQESIAPFLTTLRRIREEVKKVIVGQEELLDLTLISLLTSGHSLIIGVPGLAKTLTVRTLAQVLSLEFKRIQFTPDLLPSDITGVEILEGNPLTGVKGFTFQKGPLFTNLLLADEINRTPPRTQSALLEAMQERAVTVGGTTYPLPDPFLVLATQNPIEQEGTFPLPEAQLDRFFFSIELTYPTYEEELKIIDRTTTGNPPQVEIVGDKETILALKGITPLVYIEPELKEIAVRLVRATRPNLTPISLVNKYVAYGASPRASQDLVLGAKARALLSGRTEVNLEDILRTLPWVLTHRIVLHYSAIREGIHPKKIVEEVIHSTPLPL
jgi:MoxR-like ATPase